MPTPKVTPPTQRGAQHSDRIGDNPNTRIRDARFPDARIPDPYADQPITDAAEPGYCESVAATFLVEVIPEAPVVDTGSIAPKKPDSRKS